MKKKGSINNIIKYNLNIMNYHPIILIFHHIKLMYHNNIMKCHHNIMNYHHNIKLTVEDSYGVPQILKTFLLACNRLYPSVYAYIQLFWCYDIIICWDVLYRSFCREYLSVCLCRWRAANIDYSRHFYLKSVYCYNDLHSSLNASWLFNCCDGGSNIKLLA